jgi:hypothetical protein
MPSLAVLDPVFDSTAPLYLPAGWRRHNDGQKIPSARADNDPSAGQELSDQANDSDGQGLTHVSRMIDPRDSLVAVMP